MCVVVFGATGYIGRAVVKELAASRSGGRKDSFDIDYQATINCHKAVKEAGGAHFVLLSAICVQKPLLAFQEAKLQAESYIKENSGDMAYYLVQPTAFFK